MARDEVIEGSVAIGLMRVAVVGCCIVIAIMRTRMVASSRSAVCKYRRLFVADSADTDEGGSGKEGDNKDEAKETGSPLKMPFGFA